MGRAHGHTRATALAGFDTAFGRRRGSSARLHWAQQLSDFRADLDVTRAFSAIAAERSRWREIPEARALFDAASDRFARTLPPVEDNMRELLGRVKLTVDDSALDVGQVRAAAREPFGELLLDAAAAADWDPSTCFPAARDILFDVVCARVGEQWQAHPQSFETPAWRERLRTADGQHVDPATVFDADAARALYRQGESGLLEHVAERVTLARAADGPRPRSAPDGA